MGFFARRKAAKLLDEGIELFRQGDLRGAEERFVQGLSFDPNSLELHLNYGDVLKATGRPKAAEVEYKKAQIMEPERSDPYGSLAALYHSQKRYEEALEQYELAMSKGVNDLNIKMNLAQLYMDTFRFTEMKQVYRSILPHVTDPRLKKMIEERLR